jgi:hypothetical protein
MRLQPYQTALLGFALFMAGVLCALILVHGHAQAPGASPLETPF